MASSNRIRFIANTFVFTALVGQIVSSNGKLCRRTIDCNEPECSTNSTVFVHTAVTENTTTLHYMLGTAGYPTVLVARGNNPGSCNASLDDVKVNESEYVETQREGSVKFTKDFSFDKDYSFALVLRSVVEFNVYDSEANDSFCSNGCFPQSFWSAESFMCNHTKETYADVQKTAKQTYCIRPLTDLSWGHIGDVSISAEIPQDEIVQNSTAGLSLKFDPKVESGHASYFPTPFFTPTSMVLDTVLSNIKYSNHTRAAIPDTRLALEMLVVHGPGVDPGEVVQRFNSDDEYTPSVFYTTIYNIKHNSSGTNGYMVWKAISYEDDSRKSSASEQAFYNFQSENPSDIPPSLAQAFFGNHNVTIRRMFMVFGTDGDEQGLRGSHFTWTTVIGTGAPAEETISAVVIIVIIVGFGLPLVMVVIGTAFLFVQKAIWKPLKRWRRKKEGYEPL